MHALRRLRHIVGHEEHDRIVREFFDADSVAAAFGLINDDEPPGGA